MMVPLISQNVNILQAKLDVQQLSKPVETAAIEFIKLDLLISQAENSAIGVGGPGKEQWVKQPWSNSWAP